MMIMSLRACILLLLIVVPTKFTLVVSGKPKPNYKEALEKSILFFQGQRSGRLPKDQLIKWRFDSALHDGSSAGVDLTGGYYDAGDNVKFNFPMAFTITMLSWGAMEYGGNMSPTLLNQTRMGIRWGANYLFKCATATPGKLYVGVGDPNVDHKCWERPEDMERSADDVRSVYSVSAHNPGSDVASETAAALAAASIVFRSVEPKYSRILLAVAVSVMGFAIDYRGSYSDSLGSAVCPFYCSYSGYKDDLLWGAAWLLRATGNEYYNSVINSLGANDATDIFSWDNKYSGARVLLSKNALVNKDQTYQPFGKGAEDFMCRILPNSPSSTTQYTPGGLIYKLGSCNLQYVTSTTFLLTTYAKYMAVSKHTFSCGTLMVTHKTLRSLAKRQLNYILGDNPLKLSYMVGYGANYPKRIHHRGSSLPSLAAHAQPFSCSNGFQSYYRTSNPNPNLLIGAIVGGPDQNDAFSDDRTDYSHTEPATYINAAIVGPLAYFSRS